MKRSRIFTCFAMVALSQCGVLASGQAQALHETVTDLVLHLNNLTPDNLTNFTMPDPEPTVAETAVKAVSNWKQMDPENASDRSQLENLARVCYQHKYNPEPYFKDLFPGVRLKRVWRIFFVVQEVNIHYPASIEWLLNRIDDYRRFSPIGHSVYVLARQQSPRQFTFNMSQGQIQRLAIAVANQNDSGDQQLRGPALEQRLSKLEKSIQEKDVAIENLQKQLNESLIQNQELQKSFEVFQKQHAEEMSKLRSQIDAHEQRISTIQQCIAGFTNVSESTNQLMAAANEMKLSNDNSGEITKLHQQMEDLSKKFVKVQQTLPQNALDDVNARLGTLSANVEKLMSVVRPEELQDDWEYEEGLASMLCTLIPMIVSIDQVLKESDHKSAYEAAYKAKTSQDENQ